MSLNSCSPENLPFPKLFVDYLNRDKEILKFFEFDPFQDDDLKRRISTLNFKGNRRETVRLLKDYNSSFDPPAEVLQNIDKLADEKTYAIVTGQQVTLFGGPLFTIYKTLTAIRYSSLLCKKYKETFVPVFWLADEDHDFEEIASIGLPSDEEMKRFKWETDKSRDRRVSDIKLNGKFDEMYTDVREFLRETDFSSDLWKIIDECYKAGNPTGRSFGKLLQMLFGKYGLILAGSNHTGIKNQTKSVIIRSAERAESIYDTLSRTTELLENSGYHGQVLIQKSNLFRIKDDGTRTKLNFSEGIWNSDSNSEDRVTTDELIAEMDSNPEIFSPNVFLRPVLQDHLLPTLGIVGGPGEISYYAQMKEFYRLFEITMPVIFPRYSCTLIESPVGRAIEYLPFKWYRYIDRIEELESEFVRKSDSPDIEAIINQWKKQVNEVTDRMKPRVAEIDPTLENSAGKASATYFTELDKLKGKMYRAVKQQESIQLNRISKIKLSLFPNGNLQEREVAFIYFMNKYGIDIWDDLLEVLSEHDSSVHYTIGI